MTKPPEFDVCVIGTGAGGGVMIDRLTAAGFSVVALQRGPYHPLSSFTDDELANVIRDEVFSPDHVDTWRPDEGTPAVKGRFMMTGDGVGGTMTHWAGWSWRYRPDDFRVLSTEGPLEGASLADWPIGYDELEPWYEKAEWDFGVSGAAGSNPFEGPRKKGYPNPPLPARRAGVVFAEAARKLGHHPFPVPMAINSKAYGGRPACMQGGACQGYGCPINAKATTYSISIPRALATKRLDLRPDSVAFEITLGKDGRARSVRYLDAKGKEQEVFARHVVLSGNAVGSPHLLLMSKSGSFPQGLANSSGLVGRNLTFHHFAGAIAILDEPAFSFTGTESQTALDDLHASDPKRGFIRGGVVGEGNVPAKQPLFYGLVATGGRKGRTWGKDLKAHLRDFPRAMGLIAILEDLPMHANGIDLDPDVKDRFGLPAPRITHRQHPNDVAMHRWYGKKILDIAGAAGAKEAWLGEIPGFTAIDRMPMTGSLHFHGTCRMGDDPKASVVDRWCRSHDVANLWVVDGSVFPTAGGYNPTLTILANAYRVADHFVREAGRRSLA